VYPIYIGMKQGRRSANLSIWGFDANDVHEKHRHHFSLSFPDQETCPGCFTHPSNFLSNTFGLMR
jgi:hypothetical protein